MLTDPSLEQLLPKASCAYELAVLVSKRASQLVEGAQPMIPDQADNAVSLACKEILDEKVIGIKGNLPKDSYKVPLTREARLMIEAEKKAKEQKEQFRRDAQAADMIYAEEVQAAAAAAAEAAASSEEAEEATAVVEE
ncbi:MAG: DNA-directed RNA polymerase subunit omega [Clostridiales bacterium]|nr:DNA-directed RNA polymerase subunit omega [Clostridiales bacterium]